MMKNRAGLLAVAVLAVATLLMVFVIMPRISDKAKPIGETINEAGNAVKDAVALGNDTASDILSEAAKLTAEATEKVGRLVTGATDSISGLSGLYANGAVPDPARFAEARTKAENALDQLAKIEVPVTLDAATSALVDKASGAGTRTLAFLKSLPADAAAAAPSIARLAAIFAGTDDGAPAKVETPASPVLAPGDRIAPAQTQQPEQTQASVILPTFDVLRVEPDGSTVIAGKAEGGAKLEVLNSGTPISATTVTPEGDFVAIPDAPLASGDHLLSLRATGKDGKQTVSEEVATISVPREKNGQLLAMVSKPGEASRLLSLPGAVATDAPAAAPAAASTPAAASEPALPGLPAASGDLTASAPAIAPATPAAAPAVASAAATAAPEVRINAVEFEGDRIFIAGAAEANANVRAFADDIAAGQASAENTGRFVIEGKADLAPGPHNIRVETYDAAGKTISQITVPFTRPESEQAALVAQPQATATADAATTGDTAHAPLKQDDSAVIIRRGDTLWHISRRVYGQGVRYTTIYLANQDKIANPDRIEPGQTFTLPKEAVPNAEELHRKRLMGG